MFAKPLLKSLSTLLLTASLSQATHAIWIGGEDVLTLDSSESSITVTESATLNMIEGSGSAFIDAYDQATINIHNAGHISFIDAYNDSTINVDGANISWLTLHDNATFDIDRVSTSWLTLRDNSSGTIRSGDFSWVQVLDNSTANVLSLSTSWFLLGMDALVNVYGENLSYYNGLVSGTTLDGYGYSFRAYNVDSNGYILDNIPTNIRLINGPFAVPTPAGIALILLGALFLLHRKSKRS
ncbi:hypothetical protein [Permianibacter aggregans]|uniref:Putative secreted protein with PEP-CTERM sorting signal n=1 Tax=Permianibacter aggregans TaxID=1510150 RepID=A0A4R6UR76_9GAMM|nr:hypothetical protein [Permianibacter aggregans]QGX38388.1 hypothetical protein E2H98_01385 [Permianibacter aggregans]TDQ48716.1 putative secreted protein with PEP-CTERM sorting signal [Permianibacter aggregans]